MTFMLGFCLTNARADVPGTVGPSGKKIAAEAAASTAAPMDVLTAADELIEKGGLKNYKNAYEMCVKAIKEKPERYRANWMAAKACWECGNEIKKAGKAGWEDVCGEYGKRGMEFADKAERLDPQKPEGYYYYGLNVGLYSDGVSIFTALREGFKNKVQKSFEAVYKIDKNYNKGGCLIALGRFWQVLPWIAGGDRDKAEKYYREFYNSRFYGNPDTVEFNIYFAELLMDSRKTKAEARAVLEEVPKISNDPYWNKKAQEMLNNL